MNIYAGSDICSVSPLLMLRVTLYVGCGSSLRDTLRDNTLRRFCVTLREHNLRDDTLRDTLRNLTLRRLMFV